MLLDLSKIVIKPTTRLVVFDLDGTLYQKKGLACRMFFAAPKDGILMLAERKTRKHLRGSWQHNEDEFYQIYFQTMAKYCNLSVSELRSWYFHRYMPLMVSLIQKYYTPVNWLEPLLASLNKNHIKMVVLSDYGHVAEKLNALGVNISQFDWVISAPELGGLKPSPQLLMQILTKMDVAPEECVVVGDREDTDGQLAKSVGAQFCLV
jgi:HAD superfamily hydrolase (TIGR01549 family)